MKHEKEWITCDRCGVELKPFHSDFEHILSRKFLNITEKSEVQSTYRIDGIIDEINKEFLVENIQLVTTFKKQVKKYDLCKTCRKEFYKFLNKESD